MGEGTGVGGRGEWEGEGSGRGGRLCGDHCAWVRGCGWVVVVRGGKEVGKGVGYLLLALATCPTCVYRLADPRLGRGKAEVNFFTISFFSAF